MQTDFAFTCDPPLGRLRIVGDLDASTVDHLTDVLDCLVLQGCTRVEVDVEEVSYLDTRVLHVLHETHRRLRPVGDGLALIATNEYHRLVAKHAGHGALLPGSDRAAADTVEVTVPPLAPGRPPGGPWGHESTNADGTPDPSRA